MKLRPSLSKRKGGQVTIYLAFFIAALVIIIMGAVLAPLGIQFTTTMYQAGENILNNTQPTIDMIQDTDVKAQINGIVTQAKGSTTTNIDVLGAMFRYSWIIVLVAASLVIFLQTRKQVDYGGGIA